MHRKRFIMDCWYYIANIFTSYIVNNYSYYIANNCTS